MKVIFNYATRQFESMEPTLRDRFQLGGRVNFVQGSPFPVTDENIKLFKYYIENTDLDLKAIGEKIGYKPTEEGVGGNLRKDAPIVKAYEKKHGKIPVDRFKEYRLTTDKGFGKKIVEAYDEQIKNFGKANISQIVKDVYGPGKKDFDGTRKNVRKFLSDVRGYEGKANIPVGDENLSKKDLKSKVRKKKLKPITDISIEKFMAGPQGSGLQYHHMDATKTSMVTLNNVVYIPDEVNNYIQKYEGPITQRKKEIAKLNKNKPKGYKKQIDAKLNQIRNTIAKADMDLDKAGYSAFKGVIEVDTIDVNGKPLKIGGGSALRLGEGFAEELGLDPNKPLKEFTSEERIKLNQAKEALIKKSSINKPKITFGKAAKGVGKAILRKSPPVLFALGINEVAKAAEFTKDPRDLMTAFNTSADVAAKQKAIREDPTGELLQEEIANLPDVGQELPDSDEVAGLKEAFPGSNMDYLQAIEDGFQGSLEDFLRLQSIPQSDRPLTGKLDIPEMDQTMMAAQGGRVGFKDGSPDPFVDQAIAALDNPNVANQFLKDNQPSVGQMIFGKDGDRSLMQSFNTQFLDPRSYPYYAQKLVRGAANIPEFILSTPKAGAAFINDLITNAGITKGGVEEILEILDPSITRDILNGEFGNLIGLSDEAIRASEEKRTGPQRTTGGLLELAGELPGPATPFFLIGYAPKLLRQLRDIGVTGASLDRVNKEIENKVAQQGVDQTRRDLLLSIGAGAGIGFLKYLGLDTLFKSAPKAVAKQAPEIITSGGTPKYFFDFVDLIKKKGKNISEEAGTVAREKVYDYNGYTLYEKLDTGEIRIRKDTEGGGSYYIGDGEYETVDGIIRKEEITYTPKETIINDKGKPVEVKDTYDEATLRPDIDGSEGDYETGLDSIDEILELLSKDGKIYSKEDLLKMGIDPDALKNYSTGAGTIPKDMIGESNPFKPKKAGGGIMKMAGDESGPPPKSGPTPHGLPYVAKNVRPIKERK